jgi:hypothetical protein
MLAKFKVCVAWFKWVAAANALEIGSPFREQQGMWQLITLPCTKIPCCSRRDKSGATGVTLGAPANCFFKTSPASSVMWHNGKVVN